MHLQIWSIESLISHSFVKVKVLCNCKDNLIACMKLAGLETGGD